ncbi:MAG: sigma factor [Planctomycetota bacterium]|nr:sigma factor [Planctomycetota bacterium]
MKGHTTDKLKVFAECKDWNKAKQLLGQIQREYSSYLMALVYFHSGDVNICEDIVNEVFLELWEKWLDSRNSADCELDINYAWLNTVARNRALDATRRAERRVLRLDNAVLDRAAEGRDGEHIRKAHEALFELREELEGEDYSIFMFQMLNADTAKAARAAGMQYSTFRSRWEKLVPKLKKRLELKGVTLSAVALLLGAKLFSRSFSRAAASGAAGVAAGTTVTGAASAAVAGSGAGLGVFGVFKLSALLLVAAVAGGFAGAGIAGETSGPFVSANSAILDNMEFEENLDGWRTNENRTGYRNVER